MTSSKQSMLTSDWPEPSQFKKSIRLEFTLYVSGIILVLMLVTGYVISSQYVKTVTVDVVDKILVQARSYSGPAGKMIISGEEPDMLSLNNVCKRIAGDNSGVFWAGITGAEGRFLAHTDIKRVVAGAGWAPGAGGQYPEMLRSGEGFDVTGDTVYTSVPIEESGVVLGRLVVAASSEPIKRARKSSITAVAMITATMILAGIPVTILLLRRKLRPIGLITEHLKHVDFGRISLDVPFRSENEFGFLAETMRVMGSKLNLAQKELIDKERMSRDLEIAREIQASILPRAYPDRPTFRIAGEYRSALEVGGDYYDFIDFDNGDLGILIADVSGKSLPGMLVMLLTRDIVKRLARSFADPAELLAAVNTEVIGNIKKGMFVTMFFGILDAGSGVFRFASAGHNPLLLLRAGRNRPELIKTKGFPLGMVGPEAYAKRIENGEVRLSPSDWLILYTDGVNEAQNAGGDEFGMERFLDLVVANHGLPPEDLVAAVLDGHSAFVGTASQFDDITLIAVKWSGHAADIPNRGLAERTNVSA
jgi:serine phosphatase RsbU (regulator of sigma subunit)